MRTLHHTSLSSYCRKLRLLMDESGLPYQLVKSDPPYSSSTFRELCPAGEIPILEEDGKSISGNYAITEYLIESYTIDHFIGRDPETRAEVRRMVDWFDRLFDEQVTQCLVFEKYFKHLYSRGAPDSARIRHGKKHIALHMDYLEQLLAERQWMGGEQLSLADFAAAAQFSCNDYFGDVPWSSHEHVRRWYAIMKSRPSMRRLLEDRVSGYAPPSYYANPDF